MPGASSRRVARREIRVPQFGARRVEDKKDKAWQLFFFLFLPKLCDETREVSVTGLCFTHVGIAAPQRWTGCGCLLYD